MTKHTEFPEISDRRLTIIERLEKRCAITDTGFVLDGKPSPCHLWTGPTSGSGRGGDYGRMSLNGQTVATHIVAYTHYFGYVPSKKQIDHLCNQRRCCNPAHLELTTHLTNQRRRAKRAKAKQE